MAATSRPQVQQCQPVSGSLVFDDEGRVALPEAVREAMRIEPGTTLEYMVIGGALLIVPQDGQRERRRRRPGGAGHPG